MGAKITADTTPSVNLANYPHAIVNPENLITNLGRRAYRFEWRPIKRAGYIDGESELDYLEDYYSCYRTDYTANSSN